MEKTETKVKKRQKADFVIRDIAYIAIFSALAIVLGAFLEIPLGDTGFKLDFSEVIILIAYLVVGFRGTVVSMGLRGLVRFFFTPVKTGIESDPRVRIMGEIIAFVASLLIIISFIIAKKILGIKQKRLMDTQNPGFNFNKNRKKMYFVFPLTSLIFFPLVITILHVIFTAPLMFSGFEHFTIFTFLNDQNYSQSFGSILKTVITMYLLVNVFKALYSSLLFVFIRPKIEKALVKDPIYYIDDKSVNKNTIEQ